MYIRRQRKNVVARKVSTVRGLGRKLRLETLEDRRLLAIMVVTDLGDGSLASLAGDGKLSLREAVEAVNTAAPVDGIGPIVGTFGSSDTILFNSSLFIGTSPTLTLTAGQLELSSGVTISGPVGKTLTLDAQQNSRLFDIAAGSDNFTLSRMTLTGGLTTALDQKGGAIRSLTTGSLIIRNTEILANTTTGNFSKGGAIAAVGLVTIVDSSISNNRTEGTSGNGGGVFSLSDVAILRSTIANNTTEGFFANGGGVSSDSAVTLNSSTVSGNRTLGAASSAGGILGVSSVELIESTVSGNHTVGDTSSGGGVSSGGTIIVTRSTIVNNQAQGANASGGGLQIADTEVFVSGSIIANNTAGGGNADIQPGKGTLTVDHSLVGDATGLGIAAATNLLNQDPGLGPLAANGGLTETHAPLPGSPVINAGDALIVSPPSFDQRGAPFSRIADGDGNGSTVIDLGSHEVQTPVANADFDGDNDVDGSDFLAWQRGFGKNTGAVPADGDADGDHDVDGQDLIEWQSQFGGVAPVATVSDRASLIDLAIAVQLSDTKQIDDSLASLSEPMIVTESTSREQAFAILPDGQAAVVDALATAKTSEDTAEVTAEGEVAFGDELVVTAL